MSEKKKKNIKANNRGNHAPLRRYRTFTRKPSTCEFDDHDIADSSRL